MSVPTASEDVDNLATPPLSAPVPMDAPLLKKVTLPVGVPPVAEVTVAVKVTDCPCVEFALLEVMLIAVPALLTEYGKAPELLPL